MNTTCTHEHPPIGLFCTHSCEQQLKLYVPLFDIANIIITLYTHY